MKNKKLIRSFTALLAALVILGGFSVTAYAGGGDYYDEINDEPIPEETAEPQPLTPEGNMTLVDDIEGEAAEDKQFITVVTKNGNYFYIIIDRADEGENTVHFLNQVDEADLMQLMEDGQEATPAACSCTDKCVAGSVNTVCPICKNNMSECAGKEAEPQPQGTEPPAEESSGGSMGGIALVVLLLAGAGGGAFYYFKILKPKRDAAKGSTSLDDLDFDDEDEETEEAEEAETEQEDEDE